MIQSDTLIQQDLKSVLDGQKCLFEVDYSKFKESDWAKIYKKSEALRKLELELEGDRTWKFRVLSAQDCCDILIDYPELRKKCKAYSNFRADHWYKLLKAHPDFKNECSNYNAWNEINEKYIMLLLEEHPELAKYCYLDRLTCESWEQLLQEHPEVMQEIQREDPDTHNLHTIFHYNNFINAIELAEKKFGLEIVKQYAIWKQFTPEDWQKIRKNNRTFVEKYSGKIFLSSNLLEAMKQIRNAPEENYAWDDWKCNLKESIKVKVCEFLIGHKVLRNVGNFYKRILEEFRRLKYGNDMTAKQLDNYKQLTNKLKNEKCYQDLYQIIIGENVTVTRIVPAKTETAAKEACNESNNGIP